VLGDCRQIHDLSGDEPLAERYDLFAEQDARQSDQGYDRRRGERTLSRTEMTATNTRVRSLWRALAVAMRAFSLSGSGDRAVFRCHVEWKKLSVSLRADMDRRRITPCGAVAGEQNVAISLDAAARDLQPKHVPRRGHVIQTLAGTESRPKELDIPVNRYRSVTGVTGGEQAPSVAQLLRWESPLFIGGCEPRTLGYYPDLEEMHGIDLRAIELGVGDSAAGRHALQFAGMDLCAGAQAVLMLECPREHPGENQMPTPETANAAFGRTER
jgi:hypothetical protein